LAKESARVEVGADGEVRVTVGSPSNGQSHATTFAQVCAARLGVPVERVIVTSGDTAAMGERTGTFASLVTDQLWSYAVPRAQDVPPFEVERQAQPSPYNPEGIKGAGAGGVIGSLATIAAAVEDALAPRGLTLNSLPIRFEQLSNVKR